MKVDWIEEQDYYHTKLYFQGLFRLDEEPFLTKKFYTSTEMKYLLISIQLDGINCSKNEIYSYLHSLNV